jgi:outer membrane protein
MRTPVRMLTLMLGLSLGASQVNAQAQSQDARLQMSLKECIQYGLTHHRSVTIAENNIKNAKEQAREQLAGYLPQVSVNAELDYNAKLQQNVIPAGILGPTEQRITFGTKYNSTQVVQLDQKLYDQSLLTGLQANKEYNKLSEMDAEKNKENLIYNISTSYYKILVAQRQLELLEYNKTQFEKILKVTQLQAEQGVAKKVDVKQVQVNLNNVLSQISVTTNDLTLARNTLKNNVGLKQDAEITLTDTARWLNQAPAAKIIYNPFDYKGTIDYQQQKIQIDLYDIQRKSIKNQVFPVVSVFGRYGANGFGANSVTDAYKPLLDYSAVGVKVSWNLFTGFRRDAQYKEAIITMKI